MDSISVIYNPAAGRRRAEKKLAELRAILERNKMDVQWLRTDHPHHARDLAAQCRSDGVDLIIAAGGDGTVSEVAGSLVDPDGNAPELLVWPMGSGNDFVANTGSARHAREFEEALLGGATQMIDAGVLEVLDPEPRRHYFFNNAGFGLEADVISESVKLRTLRGMPLYLVAALRALRGAMMHEVRIRMDGSETWDVKQLTMVSIANGARSGGGFHLMPPAAADDGLLDVGLLRMPHRRTLLRLLGLMLIRKHLGSHWFDYNQTTGLELTMPQGLPVHADGDVLCDSVRHVRVSLEAGALRVRVRSSLVLPAMQRESVAIRFTARPAEA